MERVHSERTLEEGAQVVGGAKLAKFGVELGGDDDGARESVVELSDDRPPA